MPLATPATASGPRATTSGSTMDRHTLVFEAVAGSLAGFAIQGGGAVQCAITLAFWAALAMVAGRTPTPLAPPSPAMEFSAQNRGGGVMGLASEMPSVRLPAF